MLVETDRDQFCVKQIIEFYHRQNTNYADYFEAAWRFKHRSALGKSGAKLADFAAEAQASPKYLATVWSLLEGPKETIGPGSKLQRMWRQLPLPKGNHPDAARPAASGCAIMSSNSAKSRTAVPQSRARQSRCRPAARVDVEERPIRDAPHDVCTRNSCRWRARPNLRGSP